DNMGNTTVIRQGDIQVMSAGTGVVHSEKNKHADRPVKFLQIWVFPDERGVTPRYDQVSMDTNGETDRWQTVLTSQADSQPGTVWIHQDARFHIGSFSAGTAQEYKLSGTDRGVYLFVLEGSAEVGGQDLSRRDGLGVTDTDTFSLTAGPEGARILAMEVPMN
ncbi:MAG: pirin family protein, partial [Lewinella sp.]